MMNRNGAKGPSTMFFNKRPPLDTPMDQFLHREELTKDERSVLDVYLTGVSHALSGLNTVQTSNGHEGLFKPVDDHALDAADIENIVDDY